MKFLSDRIYLELRKDYQKKSGLRVERIQLSGEVDTRKHSAVRNAARVRKARSDALQEAVRWGEPYIFFLAPGLISWVVAAVDREMLCGGFCGGEVLSDSEPDTLEQACVYLQDGHLPAAQVRDYLADLPVYEQSRIRELSQDLEQMIYTRSGHTPLLLRRNRDAAWQQREIAQEIHQGKKTGPTPYAVEDERLLLSLIRVGHRAGARRQFNKMLAGMFLYNPRLPLLRARAVEMMGYLVRAAVEDSPMLESLLESHLSWVEGIIEAEDYEELFGVLRQALDDFMSRIEQQGYNRSSRSVQTALNYIAKHFCEPIRLEAVAAACEMSTFRIAHLVKESTGSTIGQHIRRHRVQLAQTRLRTTRNSCADIALECGFFDQSHFSRQFKTLTGTTPLRYRANSGY